MKTNIERLTSLLVDQLGIEPEDITPESRIREDLGADSLDDIELIMAIEAEFGVEIEDESAAKLTTVQAILDHLETLIS